MTSDLLIQDNAKQIEALHAGTVWSLRLDQATARQRAGLIDCHGKTMRELRRRGHRVRAAMVNRDDGEFITLRIVRDPSRR